MAVGRQSSWRLSRVLSLTGTLHVSHLTVDRLLVNRRCRLGLVPGTDAERPIEGVLFHGQEVAESVGDPHPRA